MSLHRTLRWLPLALLVAPLAAQAADATAGKAVFRQQCALCHSAQPDDGGGAQGPSLTNVIGRKAGSGTAVIETLDGGEDLVVRGERQRHIFTKAKRQQAESSGHSGSAAQSHGI
jgi:mono/diheme cytochrome c family protein